MRLIDAKVLERQIKEVYGENHPVLMGYMLRWIRKQPTIETNPKHGRWIISSDGYYPYCPFCKEEPYRANNRDLPNFCPNCGADMREGEADD